MSYKGLLYNPFTIRNYYNHMAWEIENFWDKAWSNSLAHRPQDINKNWRPKSSIRKVNESIIASWHEPASRDDIEQTYILLTGLTESSLIALQVDDENPILVRTVAKSLLEWFKKWHWALESILLRWIGAPKWNGDAPTMLIDKANILVMLPPIQKE